jgi:flagellar FliL protein
VSLTRKLLIWFFLSALSSVVMAADQASDSSGEEAPPEGSIYLPLKPTFVVNYGGEGRLRYLKADLAVRVEGPEAASSVRHHLPYIRNNLVMLFASQTDASLESQAGKEALRKEALAEVRAVIMQEDGQDGIVDLYFDNFIVQK